MNEDDKLPPVDFGLLAEGLKSLRPAQVPDFVQARLQFELGRIQGRREARKAMLAYASAACVLTWFVSTSNVIRNESNVMNPVKSTDLAANRTGNDGSSMVWSLDDVKRVAREIEMPSITVTSRTVETQPVREPSKFLSRETPPQEGWDRRRWYRELFEESLSGSG